MALRGTLPERYPHMIAHYRAGEAHAIDILKTDFGHWPPNHLDIVHAPDMVVKFGSLWREPRDVKKMLPDLPYAVKMAYQLRRTTEHSFMSLTMHAAMASIQLSGKVKLDSKPDTVHFNDVHRFFHGTRSGRKLTSHILNHEFKHVVQARDRATSLSSSVDERRIDMQGLLLRYTPTHNRYLAEECEVQARMHTLLVGAYHQFERLPLTRAGLYKCLASQEVNVPDHYLDMDYSAQNDFAFPFIRNDEHYDRYADKVAAREINTVIHSLADAEAEDRFWEEVIPFIYGDWLELMGDRLGHKRMGHTHNIQLREIFFRAAADSTEAAFEIRARQKLKYDIPETLMQGMKDSLQSAEKVVDVMDKDDAVDLACILASGTRYRELGTSAFVSNRNDRGEYDRLSADSLRQVWGRNDLHPQDRALIRDATRDYSQQNRERYISRHVKRAGQNSAYPSLISELSA